MSAVQRIRTSKPLLRIIVLAPKKLKDVWEFPISPADLSAKNFKSGNKPEDIFRTISTGLDGTPMVGFHGTLSEEQIWELVAYLRELRTKS